MRQFDRDAEKELHRYKFDPKDGHYQPSKIEPRPPTDRARYRPHQKGNAINFGANRFNQQYSAASALTRKGKVYLCPC